MGAELVAWRSGRMALLLIAVLALIAGAASTPCPRARRSREADLVEKLRRCGKAGASPPLEVHRLERKTVCQSLDQLATELNFDEPRMQAYCDVLFRDETSLLLRELRGQAEIP
jgi:hypothetical protein